MSAFKRSALLEREVRQKLESLLPKDVRVVKASKYTESEEVFREKLSIAPPDYYVKSGDNKIAVIDVMAGAEGYTVRTSRYMKMSQRKVEGVTREGIPGYVIVVVIGEKDKDSPERYLWCAAEEIAECPSILEYGGLAWKRLERMYHVPIDKWNVGLETFVDELLRKTNSYL